MGWLVDFCFDLVERGFDKCTSDDNMQQSKCMHMNGATNMIYVNTTINQDGCYVNDTTNKWHDMNNVYG